MRHNHCLRMRGKAGSGRREKDRAGPQSRPLTTSGMEQMSTTSEVAMSKMTIWISAPAMRRKLRRRRKSPRRGRAGEAAAELPRQEAKAKAAAATAWCCSVPSEVRRMNWRCMRSSAPHTSTLQSTVARMRKELKPAYM